jgi:hypothetical protein
MSDARRPDAELFRAEGSDALIHAVAHVFKDDQSVDTLTLELRIVCARCGMSIVTLQGHHLMDVLDVLQQVCRKFPMQVGAAAEMPHPKGTA